MICILKQSYMHYDWSVLSLFPLLKKRITSMVLKLNKALLCFLCTFKYAMQFFFHFSIGRVNEDSSVHVTLIFNIKLKKSMSSL